ncbi:cupin domain-containing protein [Deinococcus enclensis]|uniref:Quercetin dioxygenase-like cupin family protein n=1 Tax=Deinococcus enclensis TaxID=1049582 RepID=A0ABT9MJ56_9DEIO|nr:cupin domain-containing protein [Deinococcus enclensis]MDP9766229.1 quercetin dioxygenase-like cupin family protein [Deinococcus enclensis]
MTQNKERQYKVSRDATAGWEGEHQLIHTQSSSMRLWENEEPADTADKQPKTNDYDTLGYVIKGRVELLIEGQTIDLREGDSYLVPRGVEHTYRVAETLTAVEVTTPSTYRPPSHEQG